MCSINRLPWGRNLTKKTPLFIMNIFSTAFTTLSRPLQHMSFVHGLSQLFWFVFIFLKWITACDRISYRYIFHTTQHYIVSWCTGSCNACSNQEFALYHKKQNVCCGGHSTFTFWTWLTILSVVFVSLEVCHSSALQ